MQLLPLLPEDTEALRFVRLSAAARAYDAERVLDIAKRAYRDTRDAVTAVQVKMRLGDSADCEQLAQKRGYYESGRVARHVMARINNVADVAEDLRLLVVY